jgi:hypothetical protein
MRQGARTIFFDRPVDVSKKFGILVSMETLHTTRDVIAALGGTARLARCLGVGRTAVNNWAVTGVFPAKTYLAMKLMLKARKKTAPDDLWSFVRITSPKECLR